MRNLSRRDCLSLAAAAAGCLPFEDAFAGAETAARPAGIAPGGLNTIARSKGVHFGSIVNTGGYIGLEPERRFWLDGLIEDPNMLALLLDQCGIMTTANAFKWFVARPAPDVFDFKDADNLVAFAQKHQVALRGHTLLWNRDVQLPTWVPKYDFGNKPAAEAERLLVEYVSKACRRYDGRVFSFDVMNEGIAPDTGEIEASVFNKYLGLGTYEVVFHTARENAPHAQLVYNDYMSWKPKDEAHRTGVLKLLEHMKKKNAPVDALGIQSHIGSSKAPLDADGFEQVNEKAWRKFLDEVTGMGLDLVITEFDVNDRYLPADIATRDALVAEFAKRYLDLMLSYPQLRFVVAWGLVDKYSWLQFNTRRPDKLAKRTLPYDSDYRPKQLREAMAQAFAAAPERQPLKLTPAG